MASNAVPYYTVSALVPTRSTVASEYLRSYFYRVAVYYVGTPW